MTMEGQTDAYKPIYKKGETIRVPGMPNSTRGTRDTILGGFQRCYTTLFVLCWHVLYKQCKESVQLPSQVWTTVMWDGRNRHQGHKFTGWEEKPPQYNIYCLLSILFLFSYVCLTLDTPCLVFSEQSRALFQYPSSLSPPRLAGEGVLPALTSGTKYGSSLLSITRKIRL